MMKKLHVLLLLALFANAINAQWHTDSRLTNNTDESAFPMVASSGNTVHVVWFDSRDGNNEIYYKRSVDSGNTWGNDIRLTNDAALSYYPSIDVSGSNVYLVWQDNRDGNDEVYFKKSTDGGANWGTDMRLTNDVSKSSNPYITVSGNALHVAWYDTRDGNNEVYYKRSADGGGNWDNDVRITNDAGASINPTIAVSGAVVHIVWTDNRDGNNEIYHRRSADGGSNWGNSARLTNETANSDAASICANGNAVHIAWCDYRDTNYEIYYKRSTDGGVSWDNDTKLTNDGSVSNNPNIAVMGSGIHVVWMEYRDGNFEVYYKRSDNIGATWGTDTRVTNSTGISRKPDVCVSASGIHVIWYDDRNGNNEIYYNRDNRAVVSGIDAPGLRESDVIMFPNPARSGFNLHYAGYEEGHACKAVVYNALGGIVLESAIAGFDSQIDITGLTPGIYLIAVVQEGKQTRHLPLNVVR